MEALDVAAAVGSWLNEVISRVERGYLWESGGRVQRVPPKHRSHKRRQEQPPPLTSQPAKRRRHMGVRLSLGRRHLGYEAQAEQYMREKEEKQTYRRNNRYQKDFHEMILKSMARGVLQRSTSRKFARKARAYRRAYREGCDNEHASIEQMVKNFKTHRNAADFAGKFIAQA